MSSTLLEALHCRNTKAPPVWIMRQAGRYLPDYQALRKKYSLNALFSTPELAAEVTLLPFKVLNLDAAILFSDILVIAELFGIKAIFPEQGGPFFAPHLKTEEDITALEMRPAEEALSHVGRTIELLEGRLPVPLLGFAGAPFTVASYLVEGEAKAKEWIYRNPNSFHLLLSKLTAATIDYLRMQIAKGVKAVQLFDSWANVLSYAHFIEFSAYYLKQIVDALKETKVPVILFCRGSSSLAKELSALSPHAISFDWQKELPALRKEVPSSIAIQGNFDPYLLKAPHQVIENKVAQLLSAMEGDPGLIVNLGHGILPDTPLENVQCFVQAVTRQRKGA